MRSVVLVFVPVLLARVARADDGRQRRFDVGASFGYAFPAGSSERGANVGDVTFGNAPIGLDATYRLTHVFALGITGHYGFVIPTLCSGDSDCLSSLGHDVEVVATARFYMPRLFGAEPYADAGLGYEWFVAKLVDTGQTSTHSYSGPIFLFTEVALPFELGKGWTLGPALGLSLGTFVDSRLEAAGLSRDLGVGDLSVHAWLSIAVRASLHF